MKAPETPLTERLTALSKTAGIPLSDRELLRKAAKQLADQQTALAAMTQERDDTVRRLDIGDRLYLEQSSKLADAESARAALRKHLADAIDIIDDVESIGMFTLNDKTRAEIEQLRLVGLRDRQGVKLTDAAPLPSAEAWHDREWTKSLSSTAARAHAEIKEDTGPYTRLLIAALIHVAPPVVVASHDLKEK